MSFFVVLRHLAVTVLVVVGSMSSALAGDTTSATADPADYQRARYDALHFKPAIDRATDAQCLACHAEVVKASVRTTSPAGVKATAARAWY